jgi:hypothetical protein
MEDTTSNSVMLSVALTCGLRILVLPQLFSYWHKRHASLGQYLEISSKRGNEHRFFREQAKCPQLRSIFITVYNKF